jgi:uncharacterized protein YecT (DUF1311 family)
MVITKSYKDMKKIILLSVFFGQFICLFGQTQNDLNIKAKLEFEKVDKNLNQLYKKILQDYKSDTIFIKSMKEAQRQWVKYRDAQEKMKYPAYKGAIESVLPMCRNYYLTELTNSRIKELKQWIDGVEEGDVCSGSIKIKQ